MTQKRVILLLASTILTMANTGLIYPEEQIFQNSNQIPIAPPEQKTQPVPEPAGCPSKKVTELRGYLKILHNEDELSQFRIYYNGMETINNSEGFFSFPLTDSSRPTEFTLIISKQITPEFEKTNTIKNLLIDTNKHYKAYSLKTSSFGGFEWQEKKLAAEVQAMPTMPGLLKAPTTNNKKTPQLTIIPQNSIVVLVDPKYVDHLEKWHIEFADNDVHLPQILLKAHKEVKIDHAANKSLLYTLDTKIFHEKISQRTKPMEKGTIILPW